MTLPATLAVAGILAVTGLAATVLRVLALIFSLPRALARSEEVPLQGVLWLPSVLTIVSVAVLRLGGPRLGGILRGADVGLRRVAGPACPVGILLPVLPGLRGVRLARPAAAILGMAVRLATARAGLRFLGLELVVDLLGHEGLERLIIERAKDQSEVRDLEVRPLVEPLAVLVGQFLDDGVDRVVGRIVPAVVVAGEAPSGREKHDVADLVDEDVPELLETEVIRPEGVDPNARDAVGGGERGDPGGEIDLHGEQERRPEGVVHHDLGAEGLDAPDLVVEELRFADGDRDGDGGGHDDSRGIGFAGHAARWGYSVAVTILVRRILIGSKVLLFRMALKAAVFSMFLTSRIWNSSLKPGVVISL